MRTGDHADKVARRVFLTRTAPLVGAGALGPALSAACGPLPSGAPQNATATQQPVKIVFGTKFGAGERLNWATQVVNRFNELNSPKITVEHNVLGDSIQTPELLIMLSTGTGPDITASSGSWFSDFADKGALREIGQFAKRDKVDFSRWYVEEETFNYRGKQYGMPFWQSPGVYFYNASLFRRNSVPPPNDNWTWDDLLDAAQRLTKPGETWGFQTGYGWEKSWLHFLRAAGADYLNQERTKTTVSTPTAIEAMQWVVDLVLKHHVMAPPGDTTLGAGNLWNLGKVAIVIGGAGTIGSTLFAKPDFEWDLFLTPKHPKTGKRVVTTIDNPFVVTASTKAPEAAWRFLYWTAERFPQDVAGKLRINMPALKVSQADPEGWLAAPPSSMRYTLEYLKHGTTLLFHKNWLQWLNETQAQIVPAFKGEISVKEACENAARIGDSLLRGV